MKNSLKALPPLLVLTCLSLFAAANVSHAQSAGGYTITGDVHDEGGRSVPGITVCAIRADGGVVRVRDKTCIETDAQGTFTINISQPGTYQVIREKRSEGYMPAYNPFYRDPRSPIPEAIVGDGNPSARVSLPVGPKSGVITGKVIDEASDTPVQNFVVSVWQQRNPTARYEEIVKGTNSPGGFKLFAPPMPFQLRITAEGYEDWIMGGGVLISAKGQTKGPGTLVVPPGSTANFAVYLKKKDQTSPQGGSEDKRLPAPAQMTPRDNEVLDVAPRTMKLEWAPVAGAASYALEVEACWNPLPPGRARLPEDGECINPSPYLEKSRLADTSIEFVFKGAQPGRWRVWAVDQEGRRGMKSTWRRFVHLK